MSGPAAAHEVPGRVNPAGDGPGAAPAAPGTMTPAVTTIARQSISVVMCAFTQDRWQDLTQAMAALCAQTEAPREIILVIDHCPALLRRAREALPGVRAIPNSQQQGLAGARNTGLSVATGDVVAFIDDDAVAGPGWIAALADGYSDPRVAGVGGPVTPVWDTGRPRWFPPELDWVVGCSYPGMPADGGRVRNFIGANMSFRRELLAQAQGFHTGLGRVGHAPLGCEETELCLRLARLHPDGLLLLRPAASVTHRVRGQRAGWGYLRARCYGEGLSKARVAVLAGTRRALASERLYLRTTIPAALARSLGEAARGHLAALATALALLVSVLTAGAGYLVGTAAGYLGPGVAAPPARARPGRAAGRAVSRALPHVRRAAGSPLLPWAGLTLATALWAASLPGVDVSRVTTSGLGLISVLPVTFWAAVGVLTASFCAAVVRRPRWPVLALHLVLLVAVLHATPAILYGTLRYSWAWKHVGIIDFVAHHGVVFNLGGILGPYQGWPGFFALNAFLTSASGQGSALAYASWALPVNDLLWLAPVILIARTFTADQRLVWTAAWLFELGNWVGQDYFSPQAFAFFLYLTVIAVCLRWLRDPAAGPAAHRRGLRWALVLVLVPLMVAIASSHQLTPFMLISALTLLTVFRRLRPRWLPVLMAVITFGWLAYGARPWLSANGSQIFQGFGLPWANTSSHLVGQAAGGAGQVYVDWGARLLSAAVAVLAVIGYWRYRQRHGAPVRRAWFRLPLLAVAAVPSVAANSYGGEIIFRAFLFALPFLAVAAAAAFFPHPRAGRPGRSWLALTLTALALVTGFCLGNYGKEAMDYFPPQEVAAAQWLYRTAPPGTQIVSANSNYPWAFVHYDWYSYTFLDAPALSPGVLRSPVSAIARVMKPGHSPASYLILTNSEAADERLAGTWPPGTFPRILHDLLSSGRFRLIYANSDAKILQLSPAGGGP